KPATADDSIEAVEKSAAESRFLDFSAAASPFNATTEVRDRFWMKRYGPSRRRAQNASAALRIFVHHPEKTFATISAISGPTVSTIAPILRAALARRHVVPDVAMQTPPTLRAFEPDKKVLCLFLPGVEFQVGFANLVGGVAGDLEVDGLEYDVGPLECRAPKFLYRLP